MKKFILSLIIFFIFTTTSIADIPVFFMGISPYGATYVSYSMTVPDMTKADVRTALGMP
jgi:hypothetical protein